MKFIIKKELIKKVLQKILPITTSSNNLAIIECVLMSLKGNELTIKATNTEIGLIGKYAVDGKEDGEVAVNCRVLNNLTKNFTEDIEIKVKDNKLVLSANNANYKIQIADIDNFPYFRPEIETCETVPFPGLKKFIAEMIQTKDKDDRRPHACGAYLVSNTEMISTDGSRLNVSKALDEIETRDFRQLIPKKALFLVKNFLESEESFRIGFIKDNLVESVKKSEEINEDYEDNEDSEDNENNDEDIEEDADSEGDDNVIVNNETENKENFVFAVLRAGQESLCIRLLEGTFPKYNELVDVSGGYAVNFNKKKLIESLLRIQSITSEQYRAVVFDLSQEKLKLTAQNPEVGEAEEVLDITWQKEPMQIAVNPAFITQALNCINQETVDIYFGVNEKRPIIIYTKMFLSVVMPMKL